MIALVVFTDGRWDLLDRTLASAAENLHGPITTVLLVVDGSPRILGTGRNGRILGPDRWGPASLGFPEARLYTLEHGRRLGFGGTIAATWTRLDYMRGVMDDPPSYVFHLEDDFTFNRPVDLTAMCDVLDAQPHLAQLALRRQPVSQGEREAGGVVEQWPDAYTERWWSRPGSEGLPYGWLEHRLFFTTNPSLYRADLSRVGWTTDAGSERLFTDRLLADGLPWGVPGPDVRFGYWGERASGEAVHHIGDERFGTGY